MSKHWEYEDYVYPLTGERITIGFLKGTTWPDARNETWSNCRSAVLSGIQKLKDEGWEPVGEVGPYCLSFQEEISPNWPLLIFIILFTAGVGLLLYAHMFEGYVIPIEFRIKMRRRK